MRDWETWWIYFSIILKYGIPNGRSIGWTLDSGILRNTELHVWYVLCCIPLICYGVMGRSFGVNTTSTFVLSQFSFDFNQTMVNMVIMRGSRLYLFDNLPNFIAFWNLLDRIEIFSIRYSNNFLPISFNFIRILVTMGNTGYC